MPIPQKVMCIPSVLFCTRCKLCSVAMCRNFCARVVQNHGISNRLISLLYSLPRYSRRDPYDGENAAEVLMQVADKSVCKRPPVPLSMPAQITALMTDCVEDDPEQRPSFEEIDTRLKRVDSETADPGQAKRAKEASISLFDIFPRHIAEALRDGRTVEPEHKDIVTIFFSDIVGFTTMSSELEPRKVAGMLDRLYTQFDELSQKHDIFKVETIGDAYMAVTNLVKDQKNDHARRIAEFAMDAIQAANSTLIDEDDPDRGYVNIRVGFHSGSVVADVVGTRNPRYCLFGDSVNTGKGDFRNIRIMTIHSCSSIIFFLINLSDEQRHVWRATLKRIVSIARKTRPIV